VAFCDYENILLPGVIGRFDLHTDFGPYSAAFVVAVLKLESYDFIYTLYP
jgi:hypothetical protein